MMQPDGWDPLRGFGGQGCVFSKCFALLSTHFGWSFWLCLPLAGVLAAAWGVVRGFPVLRLRGDYLAIVTLAFGEIFRVVLNNWTDVPNGPSGISDIPRPALFGLTFDVAGGPGTFAGALGIEPSVLQRMIFLYYIILGLAVLTNLVATRLGRLPIGRAWEALREEEMACRLLGVNVTKTKLAAFATGAAFGGFAGAFFATRQGFISPESFTFRESSLVVQAFRGRAESEGDRESGRFGFNLLAFAEGGRGW
jgi:branched-chain amino acid transport system permease protein